MLPFIPRSVARSAKPTPEFRVASLSASLRHSYISGNDGAQSSDQEILPAAKGKAKQSEATQAADEYAIVTFIALSDYALWSEPGLRRLVASGDEGYIPLSHILHQPPFTTAFRTVLQETAVVKAIRAHANDSFDLRMIVSASSHPTWQEPWVAGNVGGYEIRRKDWKEALQRSRNYSKHEWDDRTIYMENIPLPHRSVVSICRYTLSMLRAPPTPSGSMHVQHIWLPPHHQDNPGNSPKCKGFALVTLTHSEGAGRLLSEWPWEPRHIDLRSVAEPAEAHEAARYGFRTLSKTQWNQLQEEYLAYRQKLVDEIARAEEAVEDLAGPVGRPDVQIRPSVARFTLATPNPAAAPTFVEASTYPHGCLVFVRNVHPETNKTTLRTLLSQFVQKDNATQDGLDYVDFNKGMDTCYLRLATPRHTEELVRFFAVNPRVQRQGLDGMGTTPLSSENLKPIIMEVVDGAREELYWNKVPEKIRRQAVEKAMAQFNSAESDEKPDVESEGKRKRKRKKRSSNP